MKHTDYCSLVITAASIYECRVNHTDKCLKVISRKTHARSLSIYKDMTTILQTNPNKKHVMLYLL